LLVADIRWFRVGGGVCWRGQLPNNERAKSIRGKRQSGGSTELQCESSFRKGILREKERVLPRISRFWGRAKSSIVREGRKRSLLLGGRGPKTGEAAMPRKKEKVSERKYSNKGSTPKRAFEAGPGEKNGQGGDLRRAVKRDGGLENIGFPPGTSDLPGGSQGGGSRVAGKTRDGTQASTRGMKKKKRDSSGGGFSKQKSGREGFSLSGSIGQHQ